MTRPPARTVECCCYVLGGLLFAASLADAESVHSEQLRPPQPNFVPAPPHNPAFGPIPSTPPSLVDRAAAFPARSLPEPIAGHETGLNQLPVPPPPPPPPPHPVPVPAPGYRDSERPLMAQYPPDSPPHDFQQPSSPQPVYPRQQTYEDFLNHLMASFGGFEVARDMDHVQSGRDPSSHDSWTLLPRWIQQTILASISGNQAEAETHDEMVVEVKDHGAIEVTITPGSEMHGTHTNRVLHSSLLNGHLDMEVLAHAADRESHIKVKYQMPVKIREPAGHIKWDVTDPSQIVGRGLFLHGFESDKGDGTKSLDVMNGARFSVAPENRVVSVRFLMDNSDDASSSQGTMPVLPTAARTSIRQSRHRKRGSQAESEDEAHDFDEEEETRRHPAISAVGRFILELFNFVKLVVGLIIISSALFILSFELAAFKSKKQLA